MGVQTRIHRGPETVSDVILYGLERPVKKPDASQVEEVQTPPDLHEIYKRVQRRLMDLLGQICGHGSRILHRGTLPSKKTVLKPL